MVLESRAQQNRPYSLLGLAPAAVHPLAVRHLDLAHRVGEALERAHLGRAGEVLALGRAGGQVQRLGVVPQANVVLRRRRWGESAGEKAGQGRRRGRRAEELCERAQGKVSPTSCLDTSPQEMERKGEKMHAPTEMCDVNGGQRRSKASSAFLHEGAHRESDVDQKSRQGREGRTGCQPSSCRGTSRRAGATFRASRAGRPSWPRASRAGRRGAGPWRVCETRDCCSRRTCMSQERGSVRKGRFRWVGRRREREERRRRTTRARWRPRACADCAPRRARAAP